MTAAPGGSRIGACAERAESDRTTGMTALHEQLSSSSARRARSALQALAADDHDTFGLHASIALEHAMKAFLARRHPALIAAADFDSLLHACGDSAEARTPRRAMRTIGAREALKRVGQIVPSIGILDSTLLPLLEARNAVAHLGEPIAASELRVPFFKAIEQLRHELDLDEAAYWGEFVGVVEAALEEHVKEERLLVETALAGARAAFSKRYEDLETETRAAVIRAIEAAYPGATSDEDTVECPACAHLALVEGVTETAYEQVGDDDFDFSVSFFPGYLRCRVCGLELDGEDQLELAGVATHWDLVDPDPADYFEPDFDDRFD